MFFSIILKQLHLIEQIKYWYLIELQNTRILRKDTSFKSWKRSRLPGVVTLFCHRKADFAYIESE
jgi:hypothetical protein